MASTFGVQSPFNENVRSSLEEVPKASEGSTVAFNFVLSNLAKEKQITEDGFDPGGRHHSRLERSYIDVSSLECSEWSARVVALSDGTCSGTCGGSDRTNEEMYRCVREDLEMANFLGLKAMMIEVSPEDCQSRDFAPRFAKLMRELCFRPSATSRYQSLWLRMNAVNNHHYPSENGDLHYQVDSWSAWNEIRHMIDHDPQVGIALDTSMMLGSRADNTYSSFIIDRWMAEPVKALCVNVHLFEQNSQGYPVLPPVWQPLMSKLLSLSNIHVILYDNGPDSFGTSVPKRQRVGEAGNSNSGKVNVKEARAELYRNCAAYLRHLQERWAETSLQAVINANSSYGDSQVDKLTAARRYFSSLETFRDTLQAPLQPLMDNLESETYETFERDLFKYSQYEEAILRAMQQFHSKADSEIETDSLSMIIAVVGAGRGPLVDACLRAYDSYRGWFSHEICGHEPFAQSVFALRVFAVEKNANAVRVLRRRLGPPEGVDYTHCKYHHHHDRAAKADPWDPSVVEVVASDMRNWRPLEAEKVDLLVSELLGSFGDNELSPECLDCAQHCTKATTVSIPHSYTSYLAPVANSKAWMQARDVLSGNGLHTPLVVNQHAYFQLGEAQPVFTFTHPREPSTQGQELNIEDNARFTRLEFPAPSKEIGPVRKGDVVMHGFVGYFDAVLHPEVEGGGDVGAGAAITISTNPRTLTPQMTSWFPVFFPLEVPVTLKLDEELTASFWRCVSDKRRIVWYEWCVERPVVSKIQNGNGARYSVGLD